MYKFKMITFSIVIIFSVIFIISCSKDNQPDTGFNPDEFTYDEPWPENMTSVYTAVFTDSANDQIQLPVEQAGPPYAEVVTWPSIDLTSISLGVDGDFLYMRVEFLGSIPTYAMVIPPDGEVEEQRVGNQGMNIALNTDDDIQTGGGGEGVYGIDIFFAVGFNYGSNNLVYANYGFQENDLHLSTGQVIGELGQGGPGYNFAVVRYDISELGSLFPRGETVDIGSWSEAESFNLDGSLKYHHFAFDRLPGDTTWTIPL